jgi:hypothetical protein
MEMLEVAKCHKSGVSRVVASDWNWRPIGAIRDDTKVNSDQILRPKRAVSVPDQDVLHIDQSEIFCGEAGFFLDFADGSIGGALTGLNVATRDRPRARWGTFAAFHKEDAAEAVEDDHAGSGARLYCLNHCCRHFAAISGRSGDMRPPMV